MIRARSLPAGWYPTTESGIRRQCQTWDALLGPVRTRYAAVIVPHAGWSYSGSLAYRAIRALAEDVRTIVVIGGHLRKRDPILITAESGFETPLGTLEADLELADLLRSRADLVDDFAPGNSVEVQLPLVHHLFPDARVLALRCPPGPVSRDFGRIVAECAAELDRNVCVVGSTDLTHYGPAYRFTPVGIGSGANRWAREENDGPIIEAMLGMDAERAIRIGEERRAACSAGAVAATIAYASSRGSSAGELLGYAQSSDRTPGPSFVGYAAVGYSA